MSKLCDEVLKNKCLKEICEMLTREKFNIMEAPQFIVTIFINLLIDLNKNIENLKAPILQIKTDEIKNMIKEIKVVFMTKEERQQKLRAEIDAIFIKSETTSIEALEILGSSFLDYMCLSGLSEKEINRNIENLRSNYLQMKKGLDERINH